MVGHSGALVNHALDNRAVTLAPGAYLRRAVEASRRDVVLALGAFVAVRAVVLVFLVVGADRDGRSAYGVLTKWDAQWYAGIASNGYGFVRTTAGGQTLSDYAFFPLYPWTERWVSRLSGLSVIDSGVFISLLASIAAAAGIYTVAERVVGSRAAVVATVLWSLVPIGLVESMGYSESLFTALAAWSLVATSKQRWAPAAVLACAAGVTRPTGMAVVAAICVAAVIALRRGTSDTRAVLPVLVAPLGLLGYLGWVGLQRGTPTGYFDVTDGWGNHFDGGLAFARWIGDNLTARPIVGVLLVVALAGLAMLVVLCVRERQPVPLLVYLAVIVVLALTTSGYFGSRPRYLLPAFPLLFPLARWLAARRTPVVVAVLGAATVGAGLCTVALFLGNGPP